jgi:hypothetical protein
VRKRGYNTGTSNEILAMVANRLLDSREDGIKLKRKSVGKEAGRFSHYDTARVLLETIIRTLLKGWQGITHALGRLVEHLALCTEGIRSLHQAIQMLSALKDTFNSLML